MTYGFPSPGLAIIGPGGGKTSLLRFFAAQQVRRHRPVALVDLQSEHGWADGLPNVTRWTTIEGAERGLIDLGRQLDRRGTASDNSSLLLVDDIDILHALMDARWNDRRGPGDPAMGPAVSAWAEIWLRGRGLGVHTLVTATHPAKAFWADVAGTRVIGAGASRSTWEAIAPGIEPPAEDPFHPGRVWMFNNESEPTETQLVWMTPDEAREFATG